MSGAIPGQCLCGDVRFEVTGPIHTIDACHCKMCQRFTGGPHISVDIRHDGVAFSASDSLIWYESSEWGRRGFCSTCGSSLFFRMKDRDDFWAILQGCLELPEGLSLGKEIFIDMKPGHYALAGDHPRLTGEEFLASL